MKLILKLTFCAVLVLLLSCSENDKDPVGLDDSDGDGLSDQAELSLGTNPKKQDSDGDGLSDTIELQLLDSDPLQYDSDGNGIRDSLYSTSAKDFAVIVNTADPHSVEVADYYAERREIPLENILEVSFDPSNKHLTAEEFFEIKKSVDKQTPSHVQFYVLTWTQTYRVECASITAAFTFGYSSALSNCEDTCAKTMINNYTNEGYYRPYSQLKIRPTMMLAAANIATATKLIERGIQADFSYPQNTHRTFLMETSDPARSSRQHNFKQIQQQFGNNIEVNLIQDDVLSQQENIMFYFTGLKRVPDINSNSYLPGAIADHLTSFGGQLDSDRQMTALEWLEAGVTASYGTVVEPCSHLEKFPDPKPLMKHYLAGATAIEAYWKSVRMPGQGLFVGEPMAKPYQLR